MSKNYTQEQLWKLYEKLPQELQEAVFSVETADNIWNVCEKNNVNEVSKVAKFVGYVLLGVLPIEEFQKTLEELGIEKEAAKKISQEINRFIFYPIKSALEQLYKIESATSQAAESPKPEVVARPAEEYQTISKKDDGYREPIE